MSIVALLSIAQSYGQDSDKQVISVGANIGNVPWEFQDTKGQLIGFEIDLVHKIASQLGKEVDVVNIPFSGLFSAVQSNRIDIAISSITITDERLKSVSFAQPYYDSDQSLTIRSDSSVKTVDDLRGKIVAVDTGSTGDIWTSENQQKYGFTEG